MSSTRLRPALVGATAALLAAGGALSGCSLQRDEPASQSSSPSPSPQTSASSPTATVTVTQTPTPSSTPTVTPTPTKPTATGAAGMLLAAAEFPQLNDATPWSERSTGAAGTDAFGLCQKVDLGSIGARSVLERTLQTAGAAPATAGQQVADFADAQTVVRARRVLESWHRDCASRVEGKRVKVGQLRPVTVSSGTAWAYTVSYERGGQGRFHSLGLVADGAALTLLRIDHIGQDHDYDPGKDPIELAVKAAAAKLAG